MSLVEIKRTKRTKEENPNVKLNLEDDARLVFFTELYNKQIMNLNPDLHANLTKYTEYAIKGSQ